MTESQSRYSVIERLTKSRIEKMAEKSDLKKDLIIQEQYIEDLEKNYKDYNADIEDQVRVKKRSKENEIARAKKKLENQKKVINESENVINAQIELLDKALVSIEEISKTTPVDNEHERLNKTKYDKAT